MCERCEARAKGVHHMTGIAYVSRFLGQGECKHHDECPCELCREYKWDGNRNI